MRSKMVSSLLLGSALIAASTFANADDKKKLACVGSQPETLKEMIQRHIQTPFESQFASVTSDIHKTGEENLRRLKEEMQKVSNDYDALLPAARRMAHDVARDFVAVHATRFGNLDPILKSGALLSAEELVRTQVLRYPSRSGWDPRTFYDGEIGEQDVVYFAFQPRHEKGHYGFGELTFVLDLKKMEKGYFTLNSFAVGSSMPLTVTDRGCDQENFRAMTRDYRAITFQGLDQAHELLTLSALQSLRNRELIALPIFDRAIAELDHYYDAKNRAVDVANRTLKPFVDPGLRPLDGLCELLLRLRQVDNCTDHLPKTTIGLLTNLKHLKQSATSEFSLVQAFTAFPRYHDGPTGFLYRPDHWFWETKFPRRVPLAWIQEIILPVTTFDFNSSPMKTIPLNTTNAELKIRSFAEKQGWQIQRSVLPGGKISLKFLKP